MRTSTEKKTRQGASTARRLYGGLSEPERTAERRERFLAAGLAVFGTVGLRGATVRALCKAAGLTERYFYESFDDTETLYSAVYERQLAWFREQFIMRLPELPKVLDERVRASLRLYFGVMRDERVVRVLYIESSAGSARVSAMHHANTRLFADFAAHLIRTDNPDLQISHELASAVALAINGACTTVIVQWMLGGYAISEEILIESCALLVLGTLNEIKKNPARPTPGSVRARS